MKSVVALRHVHFEGLGVWEEVLESEGFLVRYLEMGVDSLEDRAVREAIDEADLLAVLGGPIGAYDDALYPFVPLATEVIARRLRQERAILGVCLGAQMMARALGAGVAPMRHAEIGFAPVQLTEAGRLSPLRHIGVSTPVLHWHGDRFELPGGATLLATTLACDRQAFSYGEFALGLQFHLELDAGRIESWLVGHAVELGKAGISPGVLRRQASKAGTELRETARRFLVDWLSRVLPA